MELCDIVGDSDTIVVTTKSTLTANFEIKEIKEQRIFIDSIKDNVIPHITHKKHAFQIWKIYVPYIRVRTRTGKWFLEKN